MRIKMKTTRNGSRDGARTERFEAGSIHDLSHTPREVELAEVFVFQGWAEELRPGVSARVEEKAPDLPQEPQPAAPKSVVEGKRRGR